jgi:hypothetical protein
MTEVLKSTVNGDRRRKGWREERVMAIADPRCTIDPLDYAKKVSPRDRLRELAKNCAHSTQD